MRVQIIIKKYFQPIMSYQQTRLMVKCRCVSVISNSTFSARKNALKDNESLDQHAVTGPIKGSADAHQKNAIC